MKLINYKYGYYELFDCVIHGRIIVSQEEWTKIKKYLLSSEKDIFNSNLLKEDLKRFYETKDCKHYNIRVSATEKIIKKYKLNKYDRGNYMFSVLRK